MARSLFEEDVKVLFTLAKETGIEFSFVEIDPITGLLDYDSLSGLSKNSDEFSAFVYPQVNSLGLLENIDLLTDFCAENQIRSIASIDPPLLSTGGLKPPVEFGENGADFIVGDAQHLATNPSFGGPGLGIFGCRFNESNKRDIRHTPGRFIGKAKDINGRDCFVMVLSTREQHIRKEKATSNVCSNQAFWPPWLEPICWQKAKGLSAALETAVRAKNRVLEVIDGLEGIELAFPNTPALNEITLSCSYASNQIFENARRADLHLGIEVSERVSKDNHFLVKLTFTDLSTDEKLQKLNNFPFFLPCRFRKEAK